MAEEMAKLMADIFEEQASQLKQHAQKIRNALSKLDSDDEGAPAAAGKKGEKGKKVKKEKNPNQKRRVSSFQLWMSDNMKIFKANNPDVEQKNVMTILAHQWKDINPTVKAQYERKKDQMNAEIDAHNLEYGIEPPKSKEPKSGIKALTMPANANSSSSSAAKPDESKKRKANDSQTQPLITQSPVKNAPATSSSSAAKVQVTSVPKPIAPMPVSQVEEHEDDEHRAHKKHKKEKKHKHHREHEEDE